MPAGTEMFDRENIVQIIQSNCIDAEDGAGTVVLSAQKSGKSHLLDYIYRHRQEQQNAFYCWISVDALTAKVPPGQRLSDEIFLRYFLKQLHDELCAYVAREQRRREQTAEQLAQRAPGSAGDDADLAALLAARNEALRMYVGEFDTIEKYKNGIAALLERPGGSDTFELYEFIDELFPQLKRLKKRVFIFIDDVHNIVRNHDFTETLLSLLRGANSDGNLVPLLSSPVQLMHPSLHVRTRGDQTRSLFNDLKVEVLESFDDTEALTFLTWPNPPTPPLSDEEKQYILSLSGGSPHFLKEVRSRFLRRRPATAADREKFESELALAFEATFEVIWRRCTPEQRSAARGVGSGAAAAKTEWGAIGCFVREGAAFARLFGRFVERKKAESDEDIPISVAQALKVFQTALCVADPAMQQALVTFSLANRTSRPVDVRLECELEQFSLRRSRTITIAPSAEERVQMQVTLQRKGTRDLLNPEHTQIRYRVEQITPSGSRLLAEDTPFVKVLAADQFTFARRDHVDNTLVDFSWLIAAWVDQTAPGVPEIAAEAAAALRARDLTASGYPAVGGPGAALEVMAQVGELYAALRRRGIVYQSRTMAPFQDVNDFSQRVRLPAESLARGCANCLDGAVLFASVLAAADLDPLILFMPDHTILGWKMSRSPGAELRFVEITELGDKDFDGALQRGTEQWERVRRQVVSGPRADITDMSNFAILVDVRETEQAHPGKLRA